MELTELVGQITGFETWPPREKIKLFGWFLHVHSAKETFGNADIRQCFSDLHLADPNVAKYLPRMVEYNELVKVKNTFKLERSVRTSLDAKHGVHESVVQVSKLLRELPGRVPSLAQKDFLTEAIRCYRIQAYRACVVMTWNLAYSHLLDWMLRDGSRLTAFNAAITRRYPKKTGLEIKNYDDFLEELKESEVIEIGSTASLFNSNIARILREKLGKRNTAAHPSAVVIVQSQADDVVTDLVNNVVLVLN